MKRIIFLSLASITLLSCKSDYNCCLEDEEAVNSCVVVEELSKTDVEEWESQGYDCIKK